MSVPDASSKTGSYASACATIGFGCDERLLAIAIRTWDFPNQVLERGVHFFYWRMDLCLGSFWSWCFVGILECLTCDLSFHRSFQDDQRLPNPYREHQANWNESIADSWCPSFDFDNDFFVRWTIVDCNASQESYSSYANCCWCHCSFGCHHRHRCRTAPACS